MDEARGVRRTIGDRRTSRAISGSVNTFRMLRDFWDIIIGEATDAGIATIAI